MNLKEKIKAINKSHLLIAGAMLLVFFAVLLVWFNDSNSIQAESTLRIEVYFEGEYRIAGGPWKTYV